jgi:phosphoglycolate phosphatase-like HAD superfamily hydrolase
MITIIDFDLTILETRKLGRDFAKILGISFKEYRSLVLEIFDNDSKNFNDNILLAVLEKRGVIDRQNHEKMKEQIKVCLENINDYVFKEAEELLAILKKKGELVLLTCGDEEWQSRKIEHLSFKNKFDKIHIAKSSEEKLPFLEKYKDSNDDLVYINDNAKELIKAQEIIPRAKIYLVKGEYSDNTKHNIREYSHRELINEIK